MLHHRQVPSSGGISLPAGHYWPIACQEPLPIATAPVAATRSLSAAPPCGRPRASSAHCLGAPRTTDSRAPRSAGFVRIACTVEGGRRTAHAKRSATSLRSILLQFDGRADAPMLAKRPRGSGSSAAPSPLAGGLPRLHDHPVAELAQLPTRNGCGAARFSGRTSRPVPGHQRRAGPPDLRGPTATGTGKRSSFLGTAAAAGGSARLPVRVLARAIHTPSAAPGAAAGEERGPGISPGEPSGPPRSSAPPLFPRVKMRGGS
eukprot:tig00021070_g17844.t1